MLGVKRVVMTNSPCHNCLVSRTDMQRCSTSRRRTLFETRTLFAMLRTNTSSDSNDFQYFTARSMLTTLRVLSSFSLLE